MQDQSRRNLFTKTLLAGSPYKLTVKTPSGKNFMVGQSGTRTSGYSTDAGAHITFKAVNADTYIATSIVGNWTFS